MRQDIFGDNRKVPKLTINVKIKAKTVSPEETSNWNKVFGYIMKKQRTKLEFLAVSALRKLPLDEVKLSTLKGHISDEDYTKLALIEELFDERLSLDIKAFILSVLRIPANLLPKTV